MTLVRMGGGVREIVRAPLWLVDLLNCRQPATRRLGPEDKICIDFATRLRIATLEGRLKGTWTHIPHEVAGRGKLAMIRMAVARAIGLIAGSGDYVFVWPGGGLWLEMKTPKSRRALNPSQKSFARWCEMAKVPYELATSAEEAEEILQRYGVLNGPAELEGDLFEHVA